MKCHYRITVMQRRNRRVRDAPVAVRVLMEPVEVPVEVPVEAEAIFGGRATFALRRCVRQNSELITLARIVCCVTVALR